MDGLGLAILAIYLGIIFGAIVMVIGIIMWAINTLMKNEDEWEKD